MKNLGKTNMGTKIKYTESLFITNPELRSEWNVKKNEGINPELLTARSGKKVWWICNKGHEWEAAICSRANTKNFLSYLSFFKRTFMIEGCIIPIGASSGIA